MRGSAAEALVAGADEPEPTDEDLFPPPNMPRLAPRFLVSPDGREPEDHYATVVYGLQPKKASAKKRGAGEREEEGTGQE